MVTMRTAETLEPLHDAHDAAKLTELTASMSASGWVGRPLLGHERDDGTVQLWTGSHRYSAAAAAGLDIPVALVPPAALAAARESDSWSAREDRPRDPETIYCDLADWPEVVALLDEEG